MDQYLDMFLNESYEHLETLNQLLLQLEQNPEEINVVHEMFRAAHTLKGMAATMGFERMAELTHQMENVMDLLRNRQLPVTTPILDTLFACATALENMVQSIEAGGSDDVDTTALVAQLQAAMSGQPTAGQAPQVPQETPAAPAEEMGPQPEEAAVSVMHEALEQGLFAYQIRVELDIKAALKSVRAYMIFRNLEEMGTIVGSYPAADDIEQEKFDNWFVVWFVSRHSEEEIRDEIMDVLDVTNVSVQPYHPKQQAAPSVEQQVSATAEAPAAEPAASGTVKAETQPAMAAASQPAKASAPGGGAKGAKTAGKPSPRNQTLRVDISRIDRLMNMISEVVIDRSRLSLISSRINDPELTETVDHLHRLVGELQDIVLKLRMVPIENMFNRFPRMIRDLTKELNKQVELEMRGWETELDRTIMDEISDLMVHLIRNSLDHGLEPPEERRKLGKPETGKLVIAAYQRGNSVMIEVSDDGRGINREAVLKKAIEKGLTTPEEAQLLTDAQVYQFLFLAGFSTAKQVSDISGRGVGLDAVKTKIESLGGSVYVHSTPGKGTTFTIELPLTMSIIQALLVKVGGETYALPLTNVIEIAQVPAASVKQVHHVEMVPFRGDWIPLFRLHHFLELELTPQEDVVYIVIQRENKYLALQVDETLGEEEIVVKSLGNYLGSRFGLAGATIMGDGNVALILDGTQFVQV